MLVQDEKANVFLGAAFLGTMFSEKYVLVFEQTTFHYFVVVVLRVVWCTQTLFRFFTNFFCTLAQGFRRTLSKMDEFLN